MEPDATTSKEAETARKKKAKKVSRKKRKAKREFLRSFAVGIGIVGASVLGFFPVMKAWARASM